MNCLGRRVLMLVGIVMVLAASSAHAQMKWEDSLRVFGKASTERSLQFILDSLGYNIDVANDEIGAQALCGKGNVNNYAKLLVEVAGSAAYASSGYYKAHDTSVFYQWFGPSNVPGDSVAFTFPSFDSIGFYMKPNLPNENDRWFSKEALNDDTYDHMWVFPTGVPHEYIIAWEDLPNGGDQDHNDLVIKIRFANYPPVVTLPSDTTVISCNPGQICFPVIATDPNCQGDSIHLSKVSGSGTFTTQHGISAISTQHCFTPSGPGTYTFVFKVVDILGATDYDTMNVIVQNGASPVVNVPDSTVRMCTSGQICIPVSITDADCDVTTVTSSIGTYSGNSSNFDQIAKIVSLGGSVTQVGGTGAGNPLYDAGDFSGTLSTLTGVSVTLPNFAFGNSIVSSSGISGSSNMTSQMLGSPTDLTFTQTGSGGPDGTDGDGSADFDGTDNAVISFPSTITSCNGAKVDVIIFCNAVSGSNTAEVKLRNGSTDVYTTTVTIPNVTSGSGFGGVTLDVPDGLVFNRIRIKTNSGSFEVDAVAARTAPSSSINDICFNADTSGTYNVTVTVTDACGHTSSDVGHITVNINHAPVANAGADFTKFQCNFAQICFPVTFTDADNNISTKTLVSGPGTLSGNQICFTPAASGANTFIIQVTDSCGLSDKDTVVVTVTKNSAPVAVNPSNVTLFQCSPTQVCYQFTATDVNGGTLTWTKLTGSGTITTAGNYCFTPTISGTYSAAVVVTDSCGLADTTTIQYTITVNAPPVATNPTTPVSVFQCTPTQICYQFAATDNNGGTLTWTKLTGSGTITSGGNWCFTPSGAGSYSIQAVVADSCGAKDTTTLTYNVTINGAPTIAFGNDSSLFLCSAQQICIFYTVSDPQGTAKLTETMVSGFGSIDTANNKICFTPASAGTYQFIAQVTDSCGLTDKDTIVVTVGFGQAADIVCPSPTTKFICGTTSICIPVTITPGTATITTNYGTYSGGQLCFNADTSGVYKPRIIATTSCGTDTCFVQVTVTRNSNPIAVNPTSPKDTFICASAQICRQFTASDVNGGTLTWTRLTGSGTVTTGGNWCFTPSTSGSYSVTAAVTDSCGAADTVSMTYNVTINSAPNVAFGNDTTIFQCTAAQVCVFYTPSDPNTNITNEQLFSGPGTIDTANNKVCFTPASSGTSTIVVQVTDACGLTKKDTINVTINLNSNPVATDPTTPVAVFQCTNTQICYQFAATDPNGGTLTWTKLTGAGTITTGGNWCFTPSGAGSYSIQAVVSDSCGKKDTTTLTYNVTSNSAPNIVFGPDTTVFQCTATQICVFYTPSDPNNNITNEQLISGPGTIDTANNKVCYTPASSGTSQIIVQVTDACGLTKKDTINVTVNLNSNPVAVNPSTPVAVFQCTNTQICFQFSASDVDGGTLTWTKLSGSGTITTGGNWCFTPSGTGSYSIQAVVSDSCGKKDTTTLTYNVTLNGAPTIAFGNDTSIFQCTPQSICVFYTVSDPQGTSKLTETMVSGFGSIDTLNNKICFTPSGAGTYQFIAQVTDSCGLTDRDTIVVTVTTGQVADIVCPVGATNVSLCNAGQVCKALTITPVSATVTTNFGTYSSGQLCFQADSSGTYNIRVIASTSCGADTCNLVFNVTIGQAADISCPGPQTKFICGTSSVCIPMGVVGSGATVTVTPIGSYSGGSVCFTADTSGVYQLHVIASTSCGSDTCNLQVTVTKNSPPVAVNPTSPKDTFICASAQICRQFTASDVNGGTLTWTRLSGSGTVTTGGNWCFTPVSSGSYSVTAVVTDSCGAADTVNMTYNVTINSAPNVAFGNDTTVFQCTAAQICVFYTPSDPNNNITNEQLISGPGTIDTAANKVCFTPAASGTSTIIVQVTDGCGLTKKDTINVTVTLNSNPVAVNPATPVSVFQCTNTQICFQFTASDPNGGTLTWTKLSGAGTITTGGNWCFTPSGTGAYSIQAVVSDSCGKKDTTTLTYNVTLNVAPNVAFGNDTTIFQCSPTSICVFYTPTDPDNRITNEQLISGPGSIDTANNKVCFTPAVSGTSQIIVQVTDSCGLTDRDTINVTVNLNSNPVATNPTTPVAVFQCTPTQICYQFAATDPNGGTLTWTMLAGGAGTITSGGNWCFTPSGAGAYSIQAVVSDSCGKKDTTTLTYNVTINGAPTIAFGNDTSIFQCTPQPICVSYTVSDPQGTAKLTETMISGFGSIDTLNNKICFTPSGAGTYQFIAQVADSCGLTDRDTIVVTVTTGQAADIICPSPSTKFICAATSICVPVTITPGGATITTNYGTYSAGNLCFNADTSGVYVVRIIASTSCGADTCNVQVTVTKNSAPIAVNPATPKDTFICASAQICRQFTATDVNGGTLTWSRISGAGSVTSGGNWCFTPSTSGSYSVTAVVTDSCGAADTVNMTYNVTINSAPNLAFGADTTMFLCGPESKCVFYTASDPNNNIQSYTLLSGPGVVDPPNNRVCWSVTSAGTYTFILQVTDSCGATDVDTINATVNFNHAPVVNAGANQTVFQCSISQICWPVSTSDADGNLQSVVLTGSPINGTYNGSTICFTPTGTLNYEFVLHATDSCGVSTYDTVVINYTLNSPPVANAGPDQTVFQCTPTQICWPVSATDPNNNLVNYTLISGPGTYNGSTICFTPAASGNYTFITEATDACGATDRDTAVIHVTVNSAPVCVVPHDTAIFQCTPTQICLPAYATDVNGNLQFCQILSGPGSLSGGNWCYTPSVDQTVHVVMQCQDSCGATCNSSFTVDIDVNNAPTIAFGADTSIFLCSSQQVCIPFSAFDPDFPRPTTITLVSGSGTLDVPNSQVCFTPATSGSRTFIVKVQDECGLFDQDTITVNITLNTAPVASLGPDRNIFLCDSQSTVCYPASCTDVNGNLSDCIFNGPGSYNGSQLCFNPVASGAYLFTLRAEDSCGAFHVDTLHINVTLNSDPVIALGNDTTIQLCTPTQICFPYTVNDANGPAHLTEFLVSGAGAIDTLNNRVCFTPSMAGVYDFIVRVQDSCGDFDQDTLRATITFGAFANITCPSGPINVSLCSPGSVCYMLPITPAGATVTTTLGTYSGGQLCFNAASSGTYNATVIATSPCGADTCHLSFVVTIGQAAQVSCPAPQNVFLCHADSICVPITVVGSGATVTVSPAGVYHGGNVCFYAASTGTYNLTVIATTSCGSDTCSFTVNATINNNPIAQNPPASVDTFLCGPTQICRQFSATDPNGGTLTWTRISGAGTVSNTGLWCFTPSTSGSYSVVAKVQDSCGAADTVTMNYNVTLNSAPNIALGNDTTLFQCVGSQICVSYTVSDPNNNITNEQLISGPGTIDTLNNRVCFTPASAGSYTIIVQATDACGLTDRDTINVNVQLNQPPVAHAGPDSSLFLCSSSQVCFPVSATDPNNNLSGITLISGPGTLNSNTICFTPATSGVYTFIIQAQDVCGLTNRDTVKKTITINSGPSCNIPNDTSFFQCTPTQVSLPVGGTDPDGNFNHCELVSGPGTIVSGNWVFTPSSSQTVHVKIQCLDNCGASCVDSFTAVFTINTPPVANAGHDSTIFMCSTGQVCWPASCSDVNNNLTGCQLISSNGTYNGGQICFNVPAGERSYQFILQATDACGATDVDTANITIDFNEPPVINLPPNFTAFLDSPGQTCFDANISDPNHNLASVTVSPSMASYNTNTDQICFNADTSGEYCFIVTAKDGCNAQTIDTVCVTIQIDECIHVQIEKTHNTLQGQTEDVYIYLNGSGKQLGGYDLLVAYDAAALTPLNILPGSAFTACGWEYFTYRYGANGNCGSACPSGALRIIALAETNNGAYHPSCWLDGQLGSLADIQFLVSNDRTLECQYVPIRFFWLDCGDNAFSSRDGDTLYLSRSVYDFELNNITNNTYGFPGYYGAKDSCLVGGGPGKPRPIRCVDFTNGGIDIVCADSIDARGDINLNDISYEVADAVLFSNYFVHGLSVFTINQAGQIAATDVNADGLTLTVADLVYLIRVVVGDAPPTPKINPNNTDELPQISFVFDEGLLSIADVAEPVGAISLIIPGEAAVTLDESVTTMELKSNFDGKDTRVLIYSSSGKGHIEAGPVLKIAGQKTIGKIEAGTYDGVVMNVKLGDNMPKKFSLSQNYPNPFNPKTTIQFALPKKAEYTLTVYNILGQKVHQWKEEHDAGVVKIEWDASQYASGIYFYKLEAGTFSATKKMMLVK